MLKSHYPVFSYLFFLFILVFVIASNKTTPRIDIRLGEVFDLAIWLKRLAVDAKSRQSRFNPSFLKHSGIWVAADETVSNKIKK